MHSTLQITFSQTTPSSSGLMDETASSLRLTQESKPDQLGALDREIVCMHIELESLKNETDVFSAEQRAKIENDLKATKEEAQVLTEIW